MTDLILPRRRLLLGLGALLAAPAIVRASSIMPVRPIEADVFDGHYGWTFVQAHVEPQMMRWTINFDPNSWSAT